MIPQTANPVTFYCSICEEPSERICVYCTKDTCENHICEKCLRCSDCCTCEVPLETKPNGHAAAVMTVAESRAQEDSIIQEAVVTAAVRESDGTDEVVEVVEVVAAIEAVESDETPSVEISGIVPEELHGLSTTTEQATSTDVEPASTDVIEDVAAAEPEPPVENEPSEPAPSSDSVDPKPEG